MASSTPQQLFILPPFDPVTIYQPLGWSNWPPGSISTTSTTLRTTDLWWTKATGNVENLFTRSTLGGLRSQEAFTLTEEPITRTILFIFGKRHFSEDATLRAPIQETISVQLTEKVWAQYIGRQTADCEITSRLLHCTKAHMENDSDRIWLLGIHRSGMLKKSISQVISDLSHGRIIEKC